MVTVQDVNNVKEKEERQKEESSPSGVVQAGSEGVCLCPVCEIQWNLSIKDLRNNGTSLMRHCLL